MGSYPIPYYAEVRNGIPRGGEIEFHGELTSGSEQAIVFELRSNDGIPVHINIRFGYKGDHDVAIFNSYERGKWKHEDRHKMSFRPGQMIHIIITNSMMHWTIQVNGEKYHFSHRLSASDIARLEIRGDLRLNSLNFRNLDGHLDARPIPSSHYQPHFTPIAYEPSGFTDFSSSGMIGAGGGGSGHHGSGGGIGAGSGGFGGTGGIGAGTGAPGNEYGQNYPSGGIGAGGGMSGGGGGIGAGSGATYGGGIGAGSGYQGSGGYGGSGVGVGAGTANLMHSGGIGASAGYPTGGGYMGGVGAGSGQHTQYGHQGQGPQPTGTYSQGPQPTGSPHHNQPRPSGPY